MNRLFENVGEKIKSFAKVNFVIGIIAWLIAGVVFMNSTNLLMCVLTWIVGGYMTYIASLLLYGFGRIVCRSTEERDQ